MSYRELRSFAEIMRSLGYPRPISMENFRTPNFPLVADVLYWLVLRYDPSAKVPEDIDTESHRVQFLTAAAQTMANKGRIILKTKNLYAADGRAVKELLKIAKVLYNAVRACQDALATGDDEEDGISGGGNGVGGGGGEEGFNSFMHMKAADIAAARSLASEVTARGAKLHDLLKRDGRELRDARNAALAFLDAVSGSLDCRVETQYLERSVRDAISNAKDTISSLEKQVADLQEDEKSMDAKIRKRRTELERNQKRLESLQSVRPAFMDEYERLERELAEEHEAYVVRFRNLDFLQHELDEFNQRERDAADASARALRKLQRKLKDEQARLVRGDTNDDDIGEGSMGSRGGGGGGGGRPSGASGGIRPGASSSMARPSAAPASSGVGNSSSSNSAGARGAASSNSGQRSTVPASSGSSGQARSRAGMAAEAARNNNVGGGARGSSSSSGATTTTNPVRGGGAVGAGAGARPNVMGRMNAPVDDESSELSDDDDDVGADDEEGGLGDTGGVTEDDEADF